MGNAAIVAGGFDTSTHTHKDKLIEDQPISEEEKQRKKTGLGNMAIVSRVTKHAARHMDAIAVTDEEKKLAAAAMAKVRTHHDVGRGAQELASVEFTLNAIWQGWPGWPVVTQLDPQRWSHTQPQSGDAVLGFVKWTRKLRMQQVHKRIEAGLKQDVV